MKISQREAHRLRRRVKELEAMEERRRERWGATFPGVRLGRLILSNTELFALGGAIRAARLLRHAVVATVEEDNKTVNFYACEHPR